MGSAAEPQGDGERELEKRGSERRGKDGERRGSMEVSDAAGSSESARRERTSGKEDSGNL